MAPNAHLHNHRSVNERHYVLGGDWTALYWPDQTGGAVASRLTRHHYLENPPMALHGINRDLGPETGTKFLVWTSGPGNRSEEHTSELQSLMRISYAVFCLEKKKKRKNNGCSSYTTHTSERA